MASETWAQTLQAAHHQSLTACFNDALLQSSITEKLQLVSFLLQLRPHFIAWKGDLKIVCPLSSLLA